MKPENNTAKKYKIDHYSALPDAAREIRIEVFVEEQGFIEEFDATDDVSTHFLVFDGDRAVATCRIFPSEKKGSYTLGRFAVRKEYRGQGLGASLLSAAEEYVRKVNGDRLVLHAQCAAQGFYEKCGYTAYGEIEYEQDCPHTQMKKSLC
ncbi:MAG: GNAT family N-acetyltransferase [Clostridia bacterium]|nr:GNAT family N-acetyltransferase [Clostridia bacterium]